MRALLLWLLAVVRVQISGLLLSLSPRHLQVYCAAAAPPQYSLLSRGPEQAAVKAACDDLGLTLLAYSPLALGLLTGKYRQGGTMPGGPRGAVFRQLLPKLTPLLEVLEEVAARRRKTPAQVAINYCMCKVPLTWVGSSQLGESRAELGIGCRRLLPTQAAATAFLQGTVPIPGAKDLQQARDNLGALGWRLSEGEVRALEAAADAGPAMVQNVFMTG